MCNTPKIIFHIFRIVKNGEIIARIAKETIEDFNAENVKYLELRTTPRAIPKCGLTKRAYVETVINVIKECEKRKDLDIVVKLLLSVNRLVKFVLCTDYFKAKTTNIHHTLSRTIFTPDVWVGGVFSVFLKNSNIL